MNDEEQEKLQQLIAEKLAQIGLNLQMPVTFISVPNGPKAVQMAALIDDTSVVKSAADDDAIFAEIAQAEAEREKQLRDALIERQKLNAQVDLEVLGQHEAERRLSEYLQANGIGQDELQEYEERVQDRQGGGS